MRQKCLAACSALAALLTLLAATTGARSENDLPAQNTPSTLSFSTYFGGNNTVRATAVAADSSGNTYITGLTAANNLPVKSAVQATFGGATDAFVARFDRMGALVYCTYLGGSGYDTGLAIAVDGGGNAYVAGQTYSTNFPTAGTPAQRSPGGGSDAFIAKLGPGGNQLIYSTLLGGSNTDIAQGVAIDSSGNAFVAGETASYDFPLRYARQNTRKGPLSAFVAGIDGAGQLLFSTYLGGSGSDSAYAIAVDRAGEIYLTGSTSSIDFPVVNAFQPSNGGYQDAFVTKLSPNGASIVYSTYLGGAGGGLVGYPEMGLAIDVDTGGSAYVAGVTSSTEFPVLNAYQAAIAGSPPNALDAFLTKLNPDGATLAFSTYLGGINVNVATAIRLDSVGPCVAGYTFSPDFPLFRSLQAGIAGSYDAFLTCFTASGQLGFSTLLGGTLSDSALGLAVDGASAWLTGLTSSVDFPLTSPLQTGYAANQAAFLARLSGYREPLPSVPVLNSPANGIAGVTPAPSLSWGVAANAASYDVYFGTTLSPPLTANISGSSFTPGTLAPHTTYYWQVAALNTSGSALSPLWLFTTACTYSLEPSSLSLPASGGTASVNLTSADGCSWSAASDSAWLSITSAASGSGSVALTSTAAANGSILQRSGVLTIGGQTVTVTQAGVPCSYAVAPSTVAKPASAATASVNITAPTGCSWNAATDSAWLSITSATSGSGSATLTCSAANNTSSIQRIGTLTVGGQTVTVTQAANNPSQFPSLVSLNPFQGTGPNATLTFVYSDTNGWAALKSAEFILNPRWEPNSRAGGCYIKYAPATGLFTLIADDGNSIAGTATPGSASAIANSQCTLNAANSSVTGSGNTLTVVAALTFQPTFTGQRHIWMQAVDYNNVSTNWLVYGVWLPTQTTVNASPWYRIFDPFSNSYLYTFDLNEYNTLGAQGFVLQGISGLVMDGSTTVGGISNMAWYRVYVNATNSHFWTSDRNEFLTLIQFQQNYVGEGVAAFVMPYINALGQVSPQVTNTIPFYRAAFQGANKHFWTPDADEYFGRNGKHLPTGYFGEGIACYIFPASGAQFSALTGAPLWKGANVAEAADDGSPAVVSVVNGGSLASSGAIAPGEALTIYGRHLGGRVLWNGVAAEVVSVQDQEIRVVVPKELAGASEVSLEVEHRGHRSKAVKLSVVRANPAIFGSNRYGRGNAQARNEDGTMNGPDHPASRGTVVTLYTTGGGLLELPVEVHIGGQPAEVIAMQESATRAGVMEVQVRVPEGVETAAFQPVVLHVGNLFSQPGVGLAIQ